jgi:exonuclease VII large subunit
MKTRLSASTLSLLAAHQNGLAASTARLRFASPLRRIQTDRQRLDDFARRELSALQHRLALDESRLRGFERRLEALNPSGRAGARLCTGHAPGGRQVWSAGLIRRNPVIRSKSASATEGLTQLFRKIRSHSVKNFICKTC